jgi:flagellin FlaB
MLVMRKIINILREGDVGDIGIGAMIVFIAMVLVAGIAASVLIQTSTKLETQVIKTGRETLAEAASGLKIEYIEGYNASGAGKISKLAIEATARAGATAIDLSQVVIEISNSTAKYLLRYNLTVVNCSSVDGNVFRTRYGTSSKFDLIVLQDADGSVKSATPIINFGDHVIFAVNASAVFMNGGLPPRTNVFGTVIVEEGAPGIIGFTTPASYTAKVMELQ